MMLHHLLPSNGLVFVFDDFEDRDGEGDSRYTIHSAKSEYKLEESSKSILFSEERLNEIIRNFSLSIEKSELLSSRFEITITCSRKMS